MLHSSGKKKVLLVHCGSGNPVYQSLSSVNLTAIEPPVWCVMLAGFLRKKYDVLILDSIALNLTEKETAEFIIDTNSSLTVFVVYGQQPSASTQNMPANIRVHNMVKEANASIITMFMGTHSSALPKETLLETGADFVCTGEGPYSIIGVLEELKSKQFHKVGDLCFLDGKVPVLTKPYNIIQNMDEVWGHAAWDLLPMDTYRAHNWHCLDNKYNRQPYVAIYTSLGCPFKCNFCCINSPFSKNTIRYISPKIIIDNIDFLVNNYNIKNIKISDEMFVLHKSHVIGLCDMIIDRGYDLNIWAYSRIDTAQEQFLEKLKLAGFNWLAIGVESGSEYVRDGALKTLKQNDIISIINKIRQFDINIISNYIFGLPDDDISSMQETLDMAIALNTEWANFYSAMAYPGSSLHLKARDIGVMLPESKGGPGWIGYSQHGYETLPLSNNKVSSSDILKFRDYAHLKYFTNPAFLLNIKKQFGNTALEHVKYMNKSQMKRKYIIN